MSRRAWMEGERKGSFWGGHDAVKTLQKAPHVPRDLSSVFCVEERALGASKGVQLSWKLWNELTQC